MSISPRLMLATYVITWSAPLVATVAPSRSRGLVPLHASRFTLHADRRLLPAGRPTWHLDAFACARPRRCCAMKACVFYFCCATRLDVLVWTMGWLCESL